MNKYQKALWNIRQKLNEYSPTDNYGYFQDLNILQELVDRATTKKVVDKPPFKSFGWCPSCNYSINRRNHPKFCGNCSASLDWSEKDD